MEIKDNMNNNDSALFEYSAMACLVAAIILFFANEIGGVLIAGVLFVILFILARID